MGDAADLVGGEGHDTVLPEEAAVTAPDAVGLPATGVCGKHDGPDDGVKAGGVAAAGSDGYAHLEGAKCPVPKISTGFIILPIPGLRALDNRGCYCGRALINAMTSPGAACRPRARLENTKVSSTNTSNTPPADLARRISESGNACVSSAARPAARGS